MDNLLLNMVLVDVNQTIMKMAIFVFNVISYVKSVLMVQNMIALCVRMTMLISNSIVIIQQIFCPMIS